MRKFWRVFRWILLVVFLLVLAGWYYITKAGLFTFDQRFAESVAVHGRVFESLGGNVERALPDSLLVPLNETITYLEDNEATLSEVPSYAVLLSDLYLLRGNDLGIRLRFREAIENYFKSEKQAQKTSSWYPFRKLTLGNLYNLLHLAYDSSGELLKAEEQMKKSVAQFEATADERWIGLGHMNLARINSLRGDFDAAIKNTDLSIAAFNEANKNHSDSTFLISAYRRRASDYALLAGLAEKRRDTGVVNQYVEKAREAGAFIMERKNWFNTEEQTYQWPLLLQDIALNWLDSPLKTSTDEIGRMLEEVENGLAQSVRPGVDPYRATHKIMKGEWLLLADRERDALASIQEGLAMLGYNADKEWIITPKENLKEQVITGLMVYNRLLPVLLEDAEKPVLLRAQRSVVEAIQQSGRHVSGDVSQVAQSIQERSIYTKTIRTALAVWDKDLAMAVDNINFLAECQRAQILQKNLQRDNLVDQLEGAEQSWLRKDEELKKELGDLYAALSWTRDDTAIIDLELQINEVKQKRAALINHPPEGIGKGFFQLVALPRIPSLFKLQAAMQPQEALVQYIEMEQTLLVLTITKETVDIFETQPIAEWKGDLDEFKTSLGEDKGSAIFRRSAKSIYDICLAPAVADLSNDIDQLTIITDGPLRSLNLEVCLQSDIVEKDYRQMDYLLRNYSVNYEYLLASNYDHMTCNRYDQTAGLLICAPTYSTTSPNCQPSNKIESLHQLALDLVKQSVNVELVNTTKKAVREESENFNKIFFAAHGIIDQENPMQSYLLLSPDDSDDCRLAIGEIMNWTFVDADIILGSCTTEAGKNIKGSGILSIAQAMAVAGARSLVANTDYVKDKPASELLQYYFDYLKQGKRKNDALRMAKLSYLEMADDDITAPMFWSNTILIGHKD